MQNFPDHAESDDTPQVQVGEEEQHLPQPLTHTSGRRAPTSPPPPPLTPHYSHPSSATGADFLHLIKFLEETRLQEDARRRCEEEFQQQEDGIRRQEENARFQALLQMIVPVTMQRNATATA